MTKEKKILKNYILYFLTFIFICIIGISNVLAWDWTNANGITYTAVGYITNDTQIQIEVTYETNNGAPLPVSVNQQVYTQIKTLYINLDNYTFLANTRYELELNLPGLQLTGANSYSVTGYNGEQCMISLSDSVFVDEYPRWDFQCPTATTNVALSIYNSNQSPITEYGYFSWSYSHLYVSNMQINSSTTNNNDLINNANQNADRIIDNQNQNTEKEIESQKVCNYIDKNNILQDNKALNLNGSVVDLNNWGLTDYIKIDNSTIKVLEKASSSATFLCFYNINKSKISCISNNSISVNDLISIPNNSTYVRFSISTLLNQPQLQICTNGNQALNDSIEEQNETSKGILGKLGDLLSYINPTSENFFVYKLIELLGDLLKELFIPSGEYLSNWYSDFRQWIELKLGFLATPITLFLDFINLYLNLEEGDLIINIPQITVPNFEEYTIIQAQTLNWGQLLRSKTELLNLWNLYLDFIDVYLILNFLGLCEMTYNRIFGGDTSQYEYYTTEDTYTINDETGEATNHQLRQRRTRREKL